MSTSSRDTNSSTFAVSISRGTPRSPDVAHRHTAQLQRRPMRAARSGGLLDDARPRCRRCPDPGRPRRSAMSLYSAAPAALSDYSLATSLPNSAGRRRSPGAGSGGHARRARPPRRGGRSGCTGSTSNSSRRRWRPPQAGRRAHIVGHPGVPDDDIAALAVLPDDAGQRRRCAAARDTSRTSYWAPYSEVRMLSLMPPSTLMYRRTSPALIATSLTVPTSYRVTVPGPAIARPGSTTSRGTGRPTAADSWRTIESSLAARSWTGGGSSCGT